MLFVRRYVCMSNQRFSFWHERILVIKLTHRFTSRRRKWNRRTEPEIIRWLCILWRVLTRINIHARIQRSIQSKHARHLIRINGRQTQMQHSRLIIRLKLDPSTRPRVLPRQPCHHIRNRCRKHQINRRWVNRRSRQCHPRHLNRNNIRTDTRCVTPTQSLTYTATVIILIYRWECQNEEW